jgi:hypothetical protein
MIYLIEKAWCDPMGNRNDFGYEVVGYTTDLHQAITLCEKAGNFTGDETWSMYWMKKPIAKMRYSELTCLDR